MVRTGSIRGARHTRRVSPQGDEAPELTNECHYERSEAISSPQNISEHVIPAEGPRRGKGIPVGTRVCDRILIMVRFFKVRSAYRIPILILNYERTSYVSRSSFVSQVRLAEAAFAKHIVPVLLRYPRGTKRRSPCLLLSAFCLLFSALPSLLSYLMMFFLRVSSCLCG
jgi:hypothetical protein